MMIALLIALVCVSARGQAAGDYEQGVTEFKAGNYSSAAELFLRAETLKPGSTDALLYQGKCLIHLQDFAGAEKALREYASAHRDSADALYLLGFVLNRQNRPSESLEVYTKAAALVRPSSDDLKIVGLNYVLLNDYPDAIHWLERAVQFDAGNKDAWYYLGRAYYTQSQLPAARKAFLTVLQLDPHDGRAENSLGLIFESDAQPDAAIEAYRKAILWQEQNPHPTEQPYVNLGNLLLNQGRTKEGIESLEQAVKVAPGNAYCHLRLGTGYLRNGQLEGAQRELEKATQLDPNSATGHYQLGRLYKEIHALDRAKAEFDRSAELEGKAKAVTPATTKP